MYKWYPDCHLEPLSRPTGDADITVRFEKLNENYDDVEGMI